MLNDFCRDTLKEMRTFFSPKKKTDKNYGVTCIQPLKHNEIPVEMWNTRMSTTVILLGVRLLFLFHQNVSLFFSLFYQFKILTPLVWHSSLFVHIHSLSRTWTIAKDPFHAKYRINERKERSRFKFYTCFFFLYLEFYHQHAMFCSILSVCIWCFSLQYSRFTLFIV